MPFTHLKPNPSPTPRHGNQQWPSSATPQLLAYLAPVRPPAGPNSQQRLGHCPLSPEKRVTPSTTRPVRTRTSSPSVPFPPAGLPHDVSQLTGRGVLFPASTVADSGRWRAV